jgi:hypothetical protein
MGHKKRDREPNKSLTSHESDKAKRNNQEEKDKTDGAFKVLSFIAAVFAILASIATVGLYFITKKTLQIEQRAFVYVKQIELLGIDPAHPVPLGKTGGIAITFSNSGATVARNVKHSMTACIKSGRLPQDFSYPQVNPLSAPSIVPPKSEIGDVAELNRDILAQIRDNKTVTVFAWGVVIYSDVFSIAHQTQFCFSYLGALVGPEGRNQIWDMCPDHNCVDEDCPEKWGNNPDKRECPPGPKPN